MNQIINKIWSGKKNIPHIKIAFAISMCEIFLDPSNQDIKISENLMKPKVLQNMVSFINFINLHKIYLFIYLLLYYLAQSRKLEF